MDGNTTILEKIGRLSSELLVETERYKQSAENDEIFEMRREILSRIRILESELDKLRLENSIRNNPGK
jgi:hypothetical protein